MKTRGKTAGADAGAHVDLAETLRVLGEVLYATKSTAAIYGIEEEDGVEGRSTGRPGLRESSRRKRLSWRSFRARREVEGEAVATVVLVGGDGCARRG